MVKLFLGYIERWLGVVIKFIGSIKLIELIREECEGNTLYLQSIALFCRKIVTRSLTKAN
jgi:hypothetical protein